MEEVNTGGVKKFVYGKNYNPKNTPEQNETIDKAWEKHRKMKKRNKIIKIIGFVILILVVIGAYFLFR